jgi:hypothetical protein
MSSFDAFAEALGGAADDEFGFGADLFDWSAFPLPDAPAWSAPPLLDAPPPLSAAMQSVHDAARRKLLALQAVGGECCRFELTDEFLAALRKVFVCQTHARPGFANACTYALGSANKAKNHAVSAAKALAEAPPVAAATVAVASNGKKRLRAAKACEACRAGRRRCERARGAAACAHCASRAVACVWPSDGDDDGDSPTPELPVWNDALLEQLGHGDDVVACAAAVMPAGVPQALLLPIRSPAVLARRGMSLDGPSLINMNAEFVALTGLSRAELQFAPGTVVLAPLNAAGIVGALGAIQELMVTPTQSNVVKWPMLAALSVRGTWYRTDVTATVVLKNRLPVLVHVAVDRVHTDEQPIEAPPQVVSADLLEPMMRHKQFVLGLVGHPQP